MYIYVNTCQINDFGLYWYLNISICLYYLKATLFLLTVFNLFYFLCLCSLILRYTVGEPGYPQFIWLCASQSQSRLRGWKICQWGPLRPLEIDSCGLSCCNSATTVQQFYILIYVLLGCNWERRRGWAICREMNATISMIYDPFITFCKACLNRACIRCLHRWVKWGHVCIKA